MNAPATDAPPSAPFLHAGTGVAPLMFGVLGALVPGIAASVYFFGIGVLVQGLLCVATALACEAGVLRLRGRPPGIGLADGSVLVTAALIALSVPPYVPWWLAPTATGFAVLVIKHAYGGLGGNVFNPAMGGYALAVVAFAAPMSVWPQAAPDWQTALAWIAGGAHRDVDASSGATLLGGSKAAVQQMRMLSELADAPWNGRNGADAWQWVNLGFLCGGLWLLWRRVIAWRIALAMLGALYLIAALAHGGDPDRFLPPLAHLAAGGTMLAAFFIVTDPVTAPTTRLGQWIFGAGIGALVFAMRGFGAYPDGIAFAVLSMNALVPWLERATAPRIVGG